MSLRKVALANGSVLLAVVAGSMLPTTGASQSAHAPNGAHASFSVQLTIEPVFRVLDVQPVQGGHAYRILTNLSSVWLDNREYRVAHLGESTLLVPGPRVELYGALPDLRSVRAIPRNDEKPAIVSVEY